MLNKDLASSLVDSPRSPGVYLHNSKVTAGQFSDVLLSSLALIIITALTLSKLDVSHVQQLSHFPYEKVSDQYNIYIYPKGIPNNILYSIVIEVIKFALYFGFL